MFIQSLVLNGTFLEIHHLLYFFIEILNGLFYRHISIFLLDNYHNSLFLVLKDNNKDLKTFLHQSIPFPAYIIKYTI